jgi:mono/diheme cytochrome c family protein
MAANPTKGAGPGAWPRPLRPPAAAGLALLLGLPLLAAHGKPQAAARAVEADRFVLLDPQGKPAAELSYRDGGPSLVLRGSAGKPRASLALLTDGVARLSLNDREGRSRVTLAVRADGEALLDLPRKGDDRVTPAAAPESRTDRARPAADGEASAARALYRPLCAGCHGGDGRGERRRATYPHLPDFTSRRWQASRSDAQLLAVILHGKGADMPTFDDRLDQRQARALVAYVRAFGPGGARAAAAPDDFDARLAELRRLWDDLERQRRQLEKEK